MNVAHLFEESLARFGDVPVLTFEGVTHTRGALYERGRALAGALRELGVVPGDRVAVVMANSPDVPVAYHAITRVGAVVMPVLFALTPPELQRIFAGGRPRVVLTTADVAPAVAAAVEGLGHPPEVLELGAARAEGLIAAATPVAEIVERDAGDLAVLPFTSGTTGAPKGVMLSHGNLVNQVEMAAQVLDPGPDEVSLGVLPMAHIFGLVGTLTAQRFGYPSVVHRWFSPEAWLRAVEEHRVTSTGAVPTMLTLILTHPAFPGTDLSSLRRVVVGAAPLPRELADEWERRTGSTILEGYGMTETASGAVLQPPGEPRRPGSCGRPMPGTEVRVVALDGTVLGPGETGEICVRGPSVTTGYWEAPGATAEALVDGWLHTGDVGHVDADGYVYVTERLKDLIIRGGFNISPRDIEEVLHEHPAVADAAVIGRPDPVSGECVVACVVLRPGAEATTGELIAHCATRLARYKVPEEVRFFDTLPKSLVGKILKKDLRALVA